VPHRHARRQRRLAGQADATVRARPRGRRHRASGRPWGDEGCGADAAISLAVSPQAFEQAYGSLRRGGTLVFVGLPADNYIKLPIFETVLNGTKVLGSIVGTRIDLREVFELHAAGKTEVVYERRRLEDVNSAIREVETGQVKARLVFDLQAA